MDRRTFLAGATAAAALTTTTATPAAAQMLPLDTVSSYLNGLRAAQSPFTQVNADGTISTGTLYIRRPGRMRFEYNPPENLLVMASGGQVAIFDGRSNARAPEQYPLAETPLNIILEAQVDLARRGMVVGHRQEGPSTIVVAQDPRRPEIGRIDLVFTANPTELRQWVVTNETGERTTVILGALRAAADFPASLFNITYEISRRGG